MNRLQGSIIAVDSEMGLALVDVAVGGTVFSSLVFRTGETGDFLSVGQPVSLSFRETDVSLAKGFSGSSTVQNRLPAKVKSLKKGKVLARIALDFQGKEIIAIVTARAAGELAIEADDAVTAFVRADEINLVKTEG